MTTGSDDDRIYFHLSHQLPPVSGSVVAALNTALVVVNVLIGYRLARATMRRYVSHFYSCDRSHLILYACGPIHRYSVNALVALSQDDVEDESRTPGFEDVRGDPA